jgi:hypothetical protein
LSKKLYSNFNATENSIFPDLTGMNERVLQADKLSVYCSIPQCQPVNCNTFVINRAEDGVIE